MNWINLGSGTASWFGGPNDNSAGPQTACGQTLYVMNGGQKVATAEGQSNYVSLPIPTWDTHNLQCGMPVRLTSPNGAVVMGYLADKGPSSYLNRICDCSPGVFQQLGGSLGSGLLYGITVEVDTGNTNGATNYGSGGSPLSSDTPAGGFSAFMNNFIPVSSAVQGTATDPALIHLAAAIAILWAVTLALPARIGIYMPWMATLAFLAIPENSSGIFGEINKLIGGVSTINSAPPTYLPNMAIS